MEEARGRGWEELKNGELIDLAEQAGFEVILITDKEYPVRAEFNGSQDRAGGP